MMMGSRAICGGLVETDQIFQRKNKHQVISNIQ